MEGLEYKQIEKSKNKYVYEVTISREKFESTREGISKNLAKSVRIQGFRPGKAPKNLLDKEVSSKSLTESINALLPEAALEVIQKEGLNPISSLNYDLKTFDETGDIIFTFTLINQPDVNSADFKNIKVEQKTSTVEDAEIELVIKNIIKSSLPREKWEKNILPHVHSEGEEHDPNHIHDDITITDDLIEQIGYEEEKTFDGMKLKVKETLEKLKKEEADNEFASKVITEAIRIADFEVPQDFIDREVHAKYHQFEERLKQLKLDKDSYIKTQGTSMEELEKQWREQSKMDIAADLLLVNMAVKENLTPSDDEVESEIQNIRDPKVREQYQQEQNKNYLRTMLTRNKGLKKLLEIVRGS
jgi:FKBP-type peptidyl-prolyl cis-trans isomerase (trigger factor)